MCDSSIKKHANFVLIIFLIKFVIFEYFAIKDSILLIFWPLSNLGMTFHPYHDTCFKTLNFTSFHKSWSKTWDKMKKKNYTWPSNNLETLPQGHHMMRVFKSCKFGLYNFFDSFLPFRVISVMIRYFFFHTLYIRTFHHHDHQHQVPALKYTLISGRI